MPVELGDDAIAAKAGAKKAVVKPAPVVVHPVYASDVSEAGLEFIARNEGCVLHPYNDGGGNSGNATIGIGHLIHMGPFTAADAKRYAGFTEADALELLHVDAQKVVQAVRALPAHLTDPEFDALVDLGFNCGTGALTGNITLALRDNNQALVIATIREFVHAGGVVLPGLVARREREVTLYTKGIYQ